MRRLEHGIRLVRGGSERGLKGPAPGGRGGTRGEDGIGRERRETRQTENKRGGFADVDSLAATVGDGGFVGARFEGLEVGGVAVEDVVENIEELAQVDGGGDTDGVCRGLLVGDEFGLDGGGGDEVEEIDDGQVEGVGEGGKRVGVGEEGVEEGALQAFSWGGGEGWGGGGHAGIVRYLPNRSIGF